MNEKFFDLKKEKQDRMINACLKIFSKYGYDHASTDEMVKEAGISKGLLFHYFESKIGLYEFLFDYCAKYMMLETSSLLGSAQKDYFVMYEQLLGVRMQIAKNYPYMYFFLENALKDSSKDFTEDFADKIAHYREYEKSFYANVSVGYFNEKVDFELLKDVIDFTARGLMTKKLSEEEFKPEEFEKEITSYLEMLRAISYT